MREKFPRHELALLARGEVGNLLQQAGEVSQVFSLEGRFANSLFIGGDAIASQWCEWLGRCDRVIGFLSDPERTLKATLDHLPVTQVTLQSPFDDELRALHQAARFIEIVERTAPAQVMLDPPLRISQESQIFAEKTLRRLGVKASGNGLVVVHPGSGSRCKCADPRLYAEVVDWVTECGGQAVMVEGPADGEVVAAVTNRLSHHRVPVLKNCELTVLAAVLVQASLFIGNDSGVTHLAALVGAPTVALFGPTDPARWAPIGRTVQILEGSSCACRPEWSRVQVCETRSCLRIDRQVLISACRRIVPT